MCGWVNLEVEGGGMSGVRVGQTKSFGFIVTLTTIRVFQR